MLEFLYNNTKINKNKLRISWIKKNNPDFYNKLIKFENEISFKSKITSQLIYHFSKDLRDLPKCEICLFDNNRFIGLESGYKRFCSKKCASKFSKPTEIKNRRINTIKKYGVDHTSKLNLVKEKQKNTNIDKYGFISPTLDNKIRNKQINTMLDRYGVKYSGESNVLLKKSLDNRFEKYKEHILSLYSSLNIIDIPKEGELVIHCDKCDNDYNIMTNFLRLRFLRYKIETCLHCNPISSYKYTGQNEIIDYLKNNNIHYEVGNRKILSGKELDIYLPNDNIAIEFNGIYWHSDIYKDKSYHLDKKEVCESFGINLIHIWEDDWLYKKEIVISRLNNILNINTKRIMARKCNIVYVDNITTKEFLEKNHLQGWISSKVSIGLEYAGELVSIMTFGKYRRSLGGKSSDDKWELYRFCSKVNISIVGSFSRMLKFFEMSFLPKELISYANRDWTSIYSNIYSKNRLILESKTPINYWYFDSNLNKSHRFKFRKDTLVKKGYDPEKTEFEIMDEIGYMRVYDTGNLKYKKVY